MGRTGALVVGLIGGVIAAGVVVGLLIPLAPDRWHSAPVVWSTSAVLVGLGVAAAFLASRPSRE